MDDMRRNQAAKDFNPANSLRAVKNVTRAAINSSAALAAKVA
jgi:hypothetical protein